MLFLTRKRKDTLHIGDDIVVHFIRTEAGYCIVGIDAPKEVPIHRGELLRRLEREKNQNEQEGGE